MTDHGIRELWRISKEIEQQEQVVEQGRQELDELEKLQPKGQNNEVHSELQTRRGESIPPG